MHCVKLSTKVQRYGVVDDDDDDDDDEEGDEDEEEYDDEEDEDGVDEEVGLDYLQKEDIEVSYHTKWPPIQYLSLLVFLSLFHHEQSIQYKHSF